MPVGVRLRLPSQVSGNPYWSELTEKTGRNYMADARTLDLVLEPFTDQGRDSLASHMVGTYQTVDRTRPFARALDLLKGLENGLRSRTSET